MMKIMTGMFYFTFDIKKIVQYFIIYIYIALG
mgnify:CR=1 FL=1